jgi:hypothetical protein
MVQILECRCHLELSDDAGLVETYYSKMLPQDQGAIPVRSELGSSRSSTLHEWTGTQRKNS